VKWVKRIITAETPRTQSTRREKLIGLLDGDDTQTDPLRYEIRTERRIKTTGSKSEIPTAQKTLRGKSLLK